MRVSHLQLFKLIFNVNIKTINTIIKSYKYKFIIKNYKYFKRQSSFFTVRYQKFEEELDSYGKQVEEMQYWGDIEEVYRYQQRAQTLENRLITAMNKIDNFNEEEVSFGWDITQYPLRKRIADRLQPFKKLFDSICEYLTKHDKWINSMIGSYNPEDIDNDVATFYRSIII